MANLPQNDKYVGTSAFPSKPSASQVIPPKFTFKPPAIPAAGSAPVRAPNMSNPFGGAPNIAPEQWSKLRDAIAPEVGQQVDTGFQQRFGPIPADYTGFEDPGNYFNPETGAPTVGWQSPSDGAVISNIPGVGQYVIDQNNRDAFIKSKRPSLETTREERALLLRGLPPSQFQVDHIIPLWAGGADTLANKQVLAKDVHAKKTQVQAVPYTLMAYGVISAKEARAMALQWETKDSVDLPPINDTGLMSLKDAQNVAERWKRQMTEPPKVGVGDVFAALPEASKDMGKGILPDWIRAPLKGLVAGFTGGLVPAANDDDASTMEKILYMGGMIGGALIPIGWLAKGAGMTMRGISVLRGASKLAATEKGFLGAARGLSRLDREADAIRKIKGLGDKAPSVLDAVNWRNVGKFAAGSAAYGQLGAEGVVGGNLAANLGPEEYKAALPEERAAARFWEDLALGTITGAASPTLKGASMVASTGFIWSYTANPDLSDALTNAGVFAGLHGMQIPGARAAMKEAQAGNPLTQTNKKTGAVTPFKPKAPMYGLIGDPARLVQLERQIDDHGTRAANNLLVEMVGGAKNAGRPLLKENDMVPPQSDISYNDAASLTLKAKEANQNALSRGEIDFPSYVANTKRIVAAGRQLYKRGLPMEMRRQADLEDLFSIAKKAKEDVTAGIDQTRDPNIIPGSVHDLPDVLGELDSAIFKNSLAGHNSDIPSGKFPIGRVRVSGMANEHPDKATLQQFIKDMPKGEVAPFVVLAERGDLEGTWKEIEKSYTPEQLTKKERKNFAHPENAVQVIGFRKTSDGGWKSEHLGWIPREHHIRSTREGGSPFSFHSVYEKYGLPAHYYGDPKLNKDTWAPAMRQEGIKYLVANIDRNRTGYTSELSDNPFMHVTVNDENWRLSKKLAESMNAKVKPEKTSTQEAISTMKNAVNANQQKQAIATIRNRIKDPADEVLDTSPINIAVEDSPVQALASTYLKNIRSAFEEATDPLSFQASAKKWLGIDLDEAKATELFMRKNDITVREAVKFTVQAMKDKLTDGKIDVLYKNYVVPFFESPAYRNWQQAKSFPELRLMGGVKAPLPGNNMGQVAPNAPLTTPEVARPEGDFQTPEVPRGVDLTKEAVPETPAPASIAPTPASPSLAERIVARSTAIPETPTAPTGPRQPEMALINERAKGLVEEGKAQIDSLLLSSSDRYNRNNAAKRYESVINSIQVAPDGLSRQAHNEITKRVKSELQGYAEQKLSLSDEGGVAPEGSRPVSTESMPVAGVSADSFAKNIKEGLASDNGFRRASAKSYDVVLTHLFGKGYETSPEFKKYFGTDSPEGAYFWNTVFGRSQSERGQDYSQPKDLIEGFATGDMSKVGKAMDARRALEKQAAAGDDLRQGGAGREDVAPLDPSYTQDDVKGVMEQGGIRSDIQDENMVRDLTYGEARLMPNAAGLGEQTAVSAVRDIKNLFSDKQGLIKTINADRAAAGQKKVSIPANIWQGLMKAAEKYDAEHPVNGGGLSDDLAVESPRNEKIVQGIQKLVRKYLAEAKQKGTPQGSDPRTQILTTIQDAMEKDPALKKKFENLYKFSTKTE